MNDEFMVEIERKVPCSLQGTFFIRKKYGTLYIRNQKSDIFPGMSRYRTIVSYSITHLDSAMLRSMTPVTGQPAKNSGGRACRGLLFLKKCNQPALTCSGALF